MKLIAEFGVHINPLTINEFIEIIHQKIKDKKELIQLTGINAYSIVSIQNDFELRDAINKSTLVNIDGMSVVWALNFLGYKNITKASGPDMFKALIKLAIQNGYRTYFLGTTPKIIELTVQNLINEYPTLQIAGYHHGYFKNEESDKIANQIRNSKPDILFLGITSPKKELFIDKYSDFMKVPFSFGVGGVFDIIAKVTKRAPEWMQNSGLEWLYRFFQEPRRMWKRYLIGNLKFILYILNEKMKRI